MSNPLVQKAYAHLMSSADASNFDRLDYRRLDEYTNLFSPDKRYKIRFLAADTSYRSAIVKYRGHKYYVNVDPNGIVNVNT